MDGKFSLGHIQERQPNTNGQGQSDAFPIYYAYDSDPSYTVTCDKWGGCGGFMPSVVHIPNGARASIDSDHHATVIELPEALEIDFWQFNDGGTGIGTTKAVSGGGKVSTGFAEVCHETSLANTGHCPGSAVAAATPVQPGVLDAREILTAIHGGAPIHHFIYVAVGCPSNRYVWPAAQSDGKCSQGPGEGQVIWLDLSDATINGLAVPPWEKPILHAMHDYGLMVVDSACSGQCPLPWAFYGMDDQSFLIHHVAAPWTSFFNEVVAEGYGSSIGYGNNASHLPLALPTSGTPILQSNIHILNTGTLKPWP
jgi:hypothetical protein